MELPPNEPESKPPVLPFIVKEIVKKLLAVDHDDFIDGLTTDCKMGLDGV